ncbi:hypothetical protein DPMN_173018, partial [Dreissena polymorpha]
SRTRVPTSHHSRRRSSSDVSDHSSSSYSSSQDSLSSSKNPHHYRKIKNYAAELKMLYDKTHVNRDKETRKEDRLRRFLDGLIDDNARFHNVMLQELHQFTSMPFGMANSRPADRPTDRQTDRQTFYSYLYNNTSSAY